VRHRKGFTLLEMLVVVGVIMLLLTIAVAAYSKLVNSMAVKATGTTMENLRSFLAEYEQVSPISGMGYAGGGADPNFPYLGGTYFNQLDLLSGSRTPPPPIDGTDMNFAGVVTQPNDTPWTRFPANTGDTKENKAYSNVAPSSQHATNAVYNTACVMMYLARVPNISAEISKLPAKSFLLNNDRPAPSPVTLIVSNAGTNQVAPAPVMVDGWNNPIIFVPSSGIIVSINPKSPQKYVIRTSGTYLLANNPPPKATDRPFWASAGPDGNFASGDDNIYSFKQQ
jgi:prepilin-type N-terminal cleavage/methylation domain-containing protein